VLPVSFPTTPSEKTRKIGPLQPERAIWFPLVFAQSQASCVFEKCAKWSLSNYKGLKAIDKGFRRHGPRCTARMASFCEGGASLWIIRLYHNVQPSDQGRWGYRISSDGIGPIRVPEAQVPVKGKFFLRGKSSYKARSSDWRFARAADGVFGKERGGWHHHHRL
jgi:hypothetical protein